MEDFVSFAGRAKGGHLDGTVRPFSAGRQENLIACVPSRSR